MYNHMNYAYYGILGKYATLVLDHWKLATDKPLALWGQSLSVASFQ